MDPTSDRMRNRQREPLINPLPPSMTEDAKLSAGRKTELTDANNQKGRLSCGYRPATIKRRTWPDLT